MKKSPLIVITIVAFGALLTGCASTPSDTANTTSSTALMGSPHFTGPWAGDFTSAYRAASTDFERKALADGKVSDSEFSEMENRFKLCLQSKHVIFTGFKVGGGYDFHYGQRMNSDNANRAADDCSASSGLNTVGSLYFGMQRNPGHLSEATIVAECLVKRGVVPSGYSADDYARDTPTESYPFTSKTKGKRALDSCASDPLGLLSVEQER